MYKEGKQLGTENTMCYVYMIIQVSLIPVITMQAKKRINEEMRKRINGEITTKWNEIRRKRGVG